MATVGLLSFSDGRNFAHEIVRDDITAAERSIRAALEENGHVVVSGDELVWSNELAVREGRRMSAASTDCVVFNFSVWAFPHFAMLAAAEISSPLVLLSTLDPAQPGLVAMLAVAGSLDQVGRSYARVWGDIHDSEVRDRLELKVSAAHAVTQLRGMTFGRIGGRPMGMYTATAATDTWLARFGIDVEEIDQFELVRRADAADPEEARRGRLWLEQTCRAVHYDGQLLTPDLLERQLRMYLAMRELIEDLHLDFTGIKGQPELTTYFATADVAEAILNDPYDWNGPKAPHVCATEADMDGALTMQLLKLIAGTPVLFADVRHYNSERGIWDLCNSGQHATWLAERSPDPAENLSQVELFPAQFYFPAGGASVYHVAAPGPFTFARLTHANGGYRMHLLGGSAERYGDAENEALAGQTTRAWPHMFARFDPTPEAFLDSYASNHIHGVPGDRRAELRSVCALLDIDCIEL
jgi:L-fucose/D-arabinose isomerase